MSTGAPARAADRISTTTMGNFKAWVSQNLYVRTQTPRQRAMPVIRSLKKGTIGVAAAYGASSAYGFITYDTVILIPPRHYKKDSVDFTMSDSYKVTIKNKGGSGWFKICWQPGTCVKAVKGSGSSSITTPMTLESRPFRLQIAKVGSANAKASSPKTFWGLFTKPPDIPASEDCRGKAGRAFGRPVPHV